MSRSLSSAMKAAIFAPQTSQVLLILLTISHADITTLRLVANTEDVVSNGETFQAFPFEAKDPPDLEGIPHVDIRICNVSRDIISDLRGLSTPADVQIDIVLASDPDTVEAGPFAFELRRMTATALDLTCHLTREDILNEPMPGDTMTPSTFPGLFE